MSLKRKTLRIVLAVLVLNLACVGGQSVFAANYPREFYPSDSQRTPTKHQGSSGACWDFAGIATLEAYLAKNGLFKESLSEQDVLNWSNRGSQPYGWKISASSGATSTTMMGYLAAGNWPKSMAEVPFGSRKNSAAVSKPQSLRVSGIKVLDIHANNEREREKVKDAILKYGAVSSGYGNAFGGHAISIVGWNDNTKSWLVKDSLTKSYRPLSYDTKGILMSCENYCITSVERVKQNEVIHQHDNFASIYNFRWDNPKSQMKFANVFNFGDRETLNSVMFETDCDQASYKVYYAPAPSGNINTNMSSWSLLASGNVPHKGYTSVNLSKGFSVPKGSGAIIVEIDNSKSRELATIGCQGNFLDLQVKQEKGKSFVITEKGAEDILSSKRILNEGISSFSIKAITNKQ